MKDLTLSVACVLVIALSIGLVFHWIYPRVNLTAELFGLFVFVAFVLNLLCSKVWSVMHKPRTSPGAEASK